MYVVGSVVNSSCDIRETEATYGVFGNPTFTCQPKTASCFYEWEVRDEHVQRQLHLRSREPNVDPRG